MEYADFVRDYGAQATTDGHPPEAIATATAWAWGEIVRLKLDDTDPRFADRAHGLVRLALEGV